MPAERAQHLPVRDEKGAAIQHWSQAFRSQTAYLVNTTPSLRQSSTLLRRWDDEIQDLARQMLAAKQHRNVHTFPCSLPAEVLEQVFEHLAVMDPIRTVARRWGWARVTHVCQHFRAVALEHGRLWSNLSVDGDSTFWDLLLPRSQSALLSIRGSLHHFISRSAQYSRAISQHMARVRVLDIAQIPNHNRFADHPWLPILQAKAPQLRELKLSAAESSPENGLTLGSEFLQTASKLVTLHLLGIQMPWNVRAPINLRSLDLDDPSSITFSLADILQSLQCLPVLELLHLRYAIPNDVDESNTRASLPHLRILFLEDIDQRVLSLWSSLALTSVCSVYLEIDRLQSDDDGQLIALVRAHLGLHDGLAYRHICVGDEGGEDEVVRLSAHSSPDTVHQTSRKGGQHAYALEQSPLLSLSFQAMDRTQVLLPLLALFPSTAVETAIVSLRNYTMRDSLQQILRQFSSLAYIEVLGMEKNGDDQDGAEYFCWLFANRLSPRSPKTVLKNGVERYLPCLHTLSLSDFMFTRHSELTGRKLHGDITRAFERRKAAGLSNPVLKVKNSGLKKSWMRAWEELVTVERESGTCPWLHESVISDDGVGEESDTEESD